MCVYFLFYFFLFIALRIYDKACWIINSVIRAPCTLDTNNFLTFLRVLFPQEQIDFCDQAPVYIYTHTLFCYDKTGKNSLTLSCCNCSRTRDAYCFFDPIQVCFIPFLLYPFVCLYIFPLHSFFIALLRLDFSIYESKKNDSVACTRHTEFYEESLQKWKTGENSNKCT